MNRFTRSFVRFSFGHGSAHTQGGSLKTGVYCYCMLFTYIYIYIHTYIHIHTCIHVYIHIYIYIYIVYIYIYCILCVSIYIYIYTYIHTYTHTYIHTYTYSPYCVCDRGRDAGGRLGGRSLSQLSSATSGAKDVHFHLRAAWRQSATVHSQFTLCLQPGTSQASHAPGEPSLQLAIQWSTLHSQECCLSHFASSSWMHTNKSTPQKSWWISVASSNGCSVAISDGSSHCQRHAPKDCQLSGGCSLELPASSGVQYFPKTRNIDRAIDHHLDPDGKQQPRTLHALGPNKTARGPLY